MPRPKKPPLTFVEKMRKLHEAGLDINHKVCCAQSGEDGNNGDGRLASIDERIQRVLGLCANGRKRQGKMLFFVMYDIESNKVRNLVCKYLIRNGCSRIQRSIFLADQSVDVYNKIREDLAQVQECYDNEDSIIVLPVTTDYLKMMKVIGKNLNMDIITRSKTTLFF